MILVFLAFNYETNQSNSVYYNLLLLFIMSGGIYFYTGVSRWRGQILYNQSPTLQCFLAIIKISCQVFFLPKSVENLLQEFEIIFELYCSKDIINIRIEKFVWQIKNRYCTYCCTHHLCQQPQISEGLMLIKYGNYSPNTSFANYLSGQDVQIQLFDVRYNQSFCLVLSFVSHCFFHINRIKV